MENIGERFLLVPVRGTLTQYLYVYRFRSVSPTLVLTAGIFKQAKTKEAKDK